MDKTLGKFQYYLDENLLDMNERSASALQALEKTNPFYVFKLIERGIDLRHAKVSLKILIQSLNKHIPGTCSDEVNEDLINELLCAGLHLYEPPSYRAHFEEYTCSYASVEQIFLFAKMGAKNPTGKKMFGQCNWNVFSVKQICALIVLGYQIHESDFNVKSFPSRYMFQRDLAMRSFMAPRVRII